jgi:hypothetical protein
MEVMFVERWEKSRWRKDSIYLQKYHDLVVPKHRQELEKGKIKSSIIYTDDDNKRRNLRTTHQHK